MSRGIQNYFFLGGGKSASNEGVHKQKACAHKSCCSEKTKRNGKIASYQRFFTPTELKEWVESELGDGYRVEIANKENSGTEGLAAVVVTKNNESPAVGEAYGLGQPIAKKADAPMVRVDAKMVKNTEFANNLEKLSAENEAGKLFGAHELLYRIVNSFGFKGTSLDKSNYFSLDDNVSLRVANYQGNANTFAHHNHPDDNLGLVIKLSPSRFRGKESVNYLELVFYPDKIADATRQQEIINGLRDYLTTGDIGKLPTPDKYNGSGKYELEARKGNAEAKNHLQVENKLRAEQNRPTVEEELQMIAQQAEQR
jgi:hypothetical protein